MFWVDKLSDEYNIEEIEYIEEYEDCYGCGVILRRLCEQKGVEIIEAELCLDHIHMLVSKPPVLLVVMIILEKNSRIQRNK